MSLVDNLTQLHALQKVDTQIYQREQALKALDSGDALKATAISVMKRYDVVNAELQKLEATQRDRELELKTVEQKRAVVHEKLYSGRVNNPKELGDLQKDEEMIDGQISHLEDALLEVMERVEEARGRQVTLADELATAKRRWKETVTRTQTETARLQQELAALRPERVQKAEQVDKVLLRRYDEIRQRREGLGMVVTANDTCPGCHVKLTSQELNRLRAGEELTLCENCGRIVVYMP